MTNNLLELKSELIKELTKIKVKNKKIYFTTDNNIGFQKLAVGFYIENKVRHELADFQISDAVKLVIESLSDYLECDDINYENILITYDELLILDSKDHFNEKYKCEIYIKDLEIE